MSAPAFIRDLLGLTTAGVPNTADRDSTTSVAIAQGILDRLEVDAERPITGQAAGTLLETGVEAWLGEELRRLDPDRAWEVGRHRLITEFAQYEHLSRLDELVEEDGSGVLAAAVGGDYLIKPDVTVGVSHPEDPFARPFLHAAISCKWTIRSDRVQNIRHEGVILTKHRRGRQPHVVSVTTEPLPTRLASIGMGTGEVDAVYHVTFDELYVSTREHGTPEQREALELLVDQDRLLPFDHLATTLAWW